MDGLREARRLLADVTPLGRNCGELCGAACCQSPPEGEDETGMLLFPGEEQLYSQEDASWMRIVPSNLRLHGEAVPLLICDGTCPRDKRPLSCRIFPIAPKMRGEDCAMQIDDRGGAVCPLCDSGIRGLTPEFRECVRQAFELLMTDAVQADFLRLVEEQVLLHRRLLRLF